MICPTCGNEKALWLDAEKNCKRCQPMKREAPGKPKGHRFDSFPVKAVFPLGRVDYYHDINEACKYFGCKPNSIYDCITGRSNGKRIGARFVRISEYEYEMATGKDW